MREKRETLIACLPYAPRLGSNPQLMCPDVNRTLSLLVHRMILRPMEPHLPGFICFILWSFLFEKLEGRGRLSSQFPSLTFFMCCASPSLTCGEEAGAVSESAQSRCSTERCCVENTLAVARGKKSGAKWGKGGQKVQTSSYKKQ